MQSKAHDPDHPLHGLTLEQRRVLPLLAAGKTGVVVAKEISVHSSTVSQWQHRDADFKAALDQFRMESLNSAQERLCGLAHAAVDELEKLLRTELFNIRIEGRDIIVMVQDAVVLQLLPRFNWELVSLCQQGDE